MEPQNHSSTESQQHRTMESENWRSTESQIPSTTEPWLYRITESWRGRLFAEPPPCCSQALYFLLARREPGENVVPWDGGAGSRHPARPVPELCSWQGRSLLTPNGAHAGGDAGGGAGGSSRLGPGLGAAPGQGQRSTTARAAPASSSLQGCAHGAAACFSAEGRGKKQKYENKINQLILK